MKNTLLKSQKIEKYCIDYENGFMCNYTLTDGVIEMFRFVKNDIRLTYVDDESLALLKINHWDKHHELIPEKKFTVDELENFTEFTKLWYVGGGMDGMLMNSDSVFVSTPVILDQVFCQTYLKIEESIHNCEIILEQLNHDYILKKEIQLIPYYNQDEEKDFHNTLHLEILLPQDIYTECVGGKKHVDDAVKIKMFDRLKLK